MIRSANKVLKFDIAATDGSIGGVADFLFDDERWTVRYLVVDTGRWLPGRQVLISPMSVVRVDWNEQRIVLSLSRDEVKHSPGLDVHQPVSRRLEQAYFDYYGYPYYWGQAGLWGAHPVPVTPVPAELPDRRPRPDEAGQLEGSIDDAHLRSMAEVTGYLIRASDGDLGHIEGVLFDDLSWALRYFVVDTSNWWFGKHVLAAPEWIAEISWPDRSVNVNVTRQSLKTAPQYDSAEHLDRQWELEYYRHLRQPGYWLTGEEARAIKEAQSYLRDTPDPDPIAVERRSRPR